jgi:hypothetical protein
VSARDNAERALFAVICGYETFALTIGRLIEVKTRHKVPPITRLVADHPFRSAAVLGGLAYHFHRHRKV